jgi:tyrosine-specific transport protein
MGKILGGILLVAGTTIGGGMLSLPITTAKSGFLYSTLLFVACWALMTFTAFLTLEVNLCFPRNSHMVSMARNTLGKPGAFITWTAYLLLLYSVVAAYIAGGQDVFLGLLQSLGIHIPTALCGIAFVVIFGSIVTRGVRQVDIVNRILMIFKLGAIFALIFFIGKHADKTNYVQGHIPFVLSAVSIAILSFSFSPLIPTLRAYFNDNVSQLRWVIIIGTALPLLCYIGWNAAIFGSVPVAGDFGLERLVTHNQPITGLLESVHHYVPNGSIALIAKVFTSVCILTAFVSVTLSLSDYLSDGFKITKEGWGKVFILSMTFIPPLLIAIFYPRAFILFLSFAGLFCTLMFALMPALMAWVCRYRKNMLMPYQVVGGKFLIASSIVLSLLLSGLVSYELIIGF